MKFICALLLTLLCIQTVNAGDSNPTVISDIKWNHDGTKLAVGYSDGTFKILQTSDMSTLFHQPNPDSSISSFAWNDLDSKLAIGYYTDRVDIWDVVNFQKILTLQTWDNGNVVLTWWNNDNVLFVGDGGELPTLKFDANTGARLGTYYPKSSFMNPLNDGITSINLWYWSVFFMDLTNMAIIDEYDFDNTVAQLVSLEVSPNEDLVAIGFIDNTIRILDIQSREIIAILDGGQVTEGARGIINLAFNETGTRLFTITRTGMIRSWDTSTWRMIDSVELDTFIVSSDFSPDVNQITYSDIEQAPQLLMRDLCDFVAPDGASLENILPQANIFGEEAQICLTENGQYDLTTPLPTITGDITIIGNGARITMIGEGQIFPVGESGNLTLKDVTLSGENAAQEDEANYTGTLTSENVVTDEIVNILVSPDTTKIFAYRDSTIDIINSNTLQIITSIPIDTQKTVNAIWSPDSNYIALAIEGGVIEIWDSNIGLLVATLSEHPQGSEISDIEWIDNTLYSMNLFGVLIIWDMVNYQPIQVLSIDGNDLALSPDGETLAIATFLNILLLDLNTMTITVFAEQPAQITSVVWSLDVQKIASSSMDGTISIWDLDNSNNPQSIWDVNTPNDTPWVTELHWNNGYLAVRQMYNDSIAILDDETGEKLDTILVENGRFIWSDNTGYYAIFQNEPIQLYQYCDEITPSENISHIAQAIMTGNSDSFGNTICLSPNGTYILTAPLPMITGDITIIGNGARITMIGEGQIFPVGESGNLTLKDVTLSGGDD